MSSDRKFPRFMELPPALIICVLEFCDGSTKLSVARVNRALREHVTKLLWRKMLLSGEPGDLREKIQFFLKAPRPGAILRRTLPSVTDAVRTATIRVVAPLRITWEHEAEFWKSDDPESLPSNIIALIMDMRCLETLFLDLSGLTRPQRERLMRITSKGMLPGSLRTLWLDCHEDVVANIIKTIKKNRLRSLGLSGGPTHRNISSLLSTQQKIHSIHLGPTRRETNVEEILQTAGLGRMPNKFTHVSLVGRPPLVDDFFLAELSELSHMQHLSVTDSRVETKDDAARRMKEYMTANDSLMRVVVKGEHPRCFLGERTSKNDVEITGIDDLSKVAWPAA